MPDHASPILRRACPCCLFGLTTPEVYLRFTVAVMPVTLGGQRLNRDSSYQHHAGLTSKKYAIHK
jgi:hypothetical protein